MIRRAWWAPQAVDAAVAVAYVVGAAARTPAGSALDGGALLHALRADVCETSVMRWPPSETTSRHLASPMKNIMS